MRFLALRILILSLTLFATGCASTLKPPLEGQPFASEMTWPEAQILWTQTLASVVHADGTIDFDAARVDSEALHRFINYIANVSPKVRPDEFSDRAGRLAYHLNAYNALALYGVITKNVETGFESLIDRARFFALTDHVIGGEEISLLDYENEVIRPIGDPRVHFALNCMVKSCPRLPKIPFLRKSMERQLDFAAREFVNDLRHVRVDADKREVKVSAIFDFYTEDFIKQTDTPTLLDYINKYREEPIPSDFELDFLDYDWTLNRP